MCGSAGVDVDRRSTERLHERHAGLEQTVAEVGRRARAVAEVVVVDRLSQPLRDRLAVAAGEPAVRREALGEDAERAALVGVASGSFFALIVMPSASDAVSRTISAADRSPNPPRARGRTTGSPRSGSTEWIRSGSIIVRKAMLMTRAPGSPLAKEASERRAGQYSTYGQAPRAPDPAASGGRPTRRPGLARLEPRPDQGRGLTDAT